MTTTLPTVPVPFLFNAWLMDWHDGDTGLFRVDRGDRDYSMWTVRLVGCALRELDAPGGVEAATELLRRVPPSTAVVLATLKPDKWRDRKDARVLYVVDGHTHDLAVDLIADGWAVPWNGRGKQPTPPWPRVIPSTSGDGRG